MMNRPTPPSRPRALRRVPLRGVDDPPRGRRARCSPRTRPTPRSPAPPRRSPSATSRSPRTTDGPLDADDARRGRRARHRPSLRPEVGGRPVDGELAAARAPPRSTRSRRFVRGGGGLIVLGETEQDKYGNNLNDLLAPLRRRDRERDRPGLRAPPRRRAVLGARRARRPARRPRAGADPLAGVDEACFYRAGTLALEQRRPGRSPARSPTASPPDAPLAAVAEHGAGRVVVARRLRPVRRRLHRRPRPRGALAQPRLLGGRAGVRRRAPAPLALGRRRRPGLGAARGARSRSCASPRSRTARSTPPTHDPARLRELVATIAASAQALAAALPAPGASTSRRSAPTSTPGSTSGFAQARLRSARSRRSGPSATAATGSSTWCVFPMYKQNASPRHLLRGADRPRPVAASGSPSSSGPLRQRRSSCRSTFVDYTVGLRLRVRGAVPGDLLDRRAPAELHFGAIFCDREAERFRRVCGAAAEILRLNLPPDAACLLASPELSRDAYIALGPDPRPHPHARRSALRPVHDPPAQPVLDVLAGGAALRPDRVRRGASSSSARASPSPATSSTRSSSTACSASRSPARGCATTTASAASCCSPSCTARATCTGPTTG